MRKLWFELRSSLWFVPTLLVLIAIALGFGFVEADVVLDSRLKPWGWMSFLKAGANGARGMLEAIASSMITIAGLAFSITIVTLSLASTQYTPRILRNFMRDRANQSVLGVFVGIYAYCLIVLRTIRNPDEGDFVPLLAVALGVLLALVGIGYLIFFIHHIASSIQASSILDAITKDTNGSIDKLFPKELGEPAESAPAAEEAVGEKDWHAIRSLTSGYLQSVDGDALWKLACAENVILRLERGIGDFVVEGAPLIASSHVLDEGVRHRLLRLYAIGNFRTVDQDVGFGIRQIVDIALKALSPGINGTTTAVSCLDYLSAILSRLAERPMASPYRFDEGKLRIIAPAPQFSQFVAEALDEIRLCASNNVTVFLCLLTLLTRVAHATQNTDRHRLLLLHAQLISALADRSIPAPYDRARINGEIDRLQKVLGCAGELEKIGLNSA